MSREFDHGQLRSRHRAVLMVRHPLDRLQVVLSCLLGFRPPSGVLHPRLRYGPPTAGGWEFKLQLMVRGRRGFD